MPFGERVYSTDRFEGASQPLAVEAFPIICCIAFEEGTMAEYNSSMYCLGLAQRNHSILMAKCFKIDAPREWRKTLPLAQMMNNWAAPLSRLTSAILH